MFEDAYTNEYITATAVKATYGIGFGTLMSLSEQGIVSRRALPKDHGEITFVFRRGDVMAYLEGLRDASGE